MQKMLTLIFANGTLEPLPDVLPDLLERADRIIAADGGANHCARLGIVPTMLIGDLDSVEADILQKLQTQGIDIRRHPPEKDATDLELALDLALDGEATTVWLFGALGGRWDMSFASILLCAQEKYRTLHITLAGPDCLMHILHPGKAFTVHTSPGRKVSLLPLKNDVHGLTLKGFQYPLRDATLRFGSTRGVSNVFSGPVGTVVFQKGLLLCVCLTNE